MSNKEKQCNAKTEYKNKEPQKIILETVQNKTNVSRHSEENTTSLFWFEGSLKRMEQARTKTLRHSDNEILRHKGTGRDNSKKKNKIFPWMR